MLPRGHFHLNMYTIRDNQLFKSKYFLFSLIAGIFLDSWFRWVIQQAQGKEAPVYGERSLKMKQLTHLRYVIHTVHESNIRLASLLCTFKVTFTFCAELTTKVKTQYVHFRLRANYFLFFLGNSFRNQQMINALQQLRVVSTASKICPCNLLEWGQIDLKLNETECVMEVSVLFDICMYCILYSRG